MSYRKIGGLHLLRFGRLRFSFHYFAGTALFGAVFMSR